MIGYDRASQHSFTASVWCLWFSGLRSLQRRRLQNPSEARNPSASCISCHAFGLCAVVTFASCSKSWCSQRKVDEWSVLLGCDRVPPAKLWPERLHAPPRMRERQERHERHEHTTLSSSLFVITTFASFAFLTPPTCNSLDIAPCATATADCNLAAADAPRHKAQRESKKGGTRASSGTPPAGGPRHPRAEHRRNHGKAGHRTLQAYVRPARLRTTDIQHHNMVVVVVVVVAVAVAVVVVAVLVGGVAPHRIPHIQHTLPTVTILYSKKTTHEAVLKQV